jgi:hypothetical protein
MQFIEITLDPCVLLPDRLLNIGSLFGVCTRTVRMYSVSSTASDFHFYISHVCRVNICSY